MAATGPWRPVDNLALSALIGPGHRSVATDLAGDVAHLGTPDFQAGYYGPVMGTDQGPPPALPARRPGLPTRGSGLPLPGSGLPKRGSEPPAEGSGLPTRGSGAPPAPGSGLPTRGSGPPPGSGLPTRGSGPPAPGSGLPTRGSGAPVPGSGLPTRGSRPPAPGSALPTRTARFRRPGRHRSPHQLSVPSDAPALILAVPGPATDNGIDIAAGIIDVASQSCPGVTVRAGFLEGEEESLSSVLAGCPRV